ncbi:hypothetical protein ACHAQJ_003491 [Trichoderma viride]
METQIFEETAQATDSHTSITQIEPRVAQKLEAMEAQATDPHVSITQIEPRTAQALEAMVTQVFEGSAWVANSHVSITQIEPRAQALEAMVTQIFEGSAQATDAHASTTQIEPRVAEIASKLAVDVEAQEQTAGLEAQEFQDLAAALTKASLSAPEARLVIAYPRDRNLKLSDDSAVIRFPQTLSGKDIFSVIQSTQHVDFTFRLPFDKQTIKRPSPRVIPSELECHIVYDSKSNNCYLAHFTITKADIYLTNLDDPSIKEYLDYGQPFEIHPGVWRILISTGGEDHPNDLNLVDILVLERYFDISIHKTNKTVSKREAADNIERERSAKRQKNEAVKEIIISRATNMLPRRRELDTDNRNTALTTPPNIVNEATATILDLQDGDTARNIVKLKAVDGCMFAIYLELLPQSLYRGYQSPFKPSDARTILHDISSALAYLATRGIFHNDIKPGNIAYSPSRGAVLLDFGLASTSVLSRAGTPWYIPPEFFDGKPRGAAGDIWALGVTMLYVLGTMTAPERTKGWLIHDVFNKNSDAFRRMKNWIGRVADYRGKLNKEDKVESLVFQMLCNEATSRVKAAVIESAIKGCEELE